MAGYAIMDNTYRDMRIVDIAARAQTQDTISKGRTWPKKHLEHTYYIGEDNRRKLKSIVPGPLFVTTYLDHVARTNNTTAQWRDTRPDELRRRDEVRIAYNLLPLWSYGTDVGGGIRLSLAHETIELFSSLAVRFGIGRQHYVALSNVGPDRNLSYEGIKSTSVLGLAGLGAYSLVSCALRAFVQGYLTPDNVPIMDEALRKLISPHRESLAAHKRGRPPGSHRRL